MAANLIFDIPAGDGIDSPFVPTITDVLRVKRIFAHTPLPAEVVDMVLEAAEYWPRTTQTIRFDKNPGGRQSVPSASAAQDLLLLRCCPLGFSGPPGCPNQPGHYMYGVLPRLRPLRKQCDPADFHGYISPSRNLRRLDHPCRKIIFTITSRDQGWASRPRPPNPFDDSHTWFEVGLERFEHGETCTDGCKTSSPDPRWPYSIDNHVRFEPKDTVVFGCKEDTLSLCQLRTVIPSLRRCTEGEKIRFGTRNVDEAYTYEFPLNPNPSLKIQTNKRASRIKSTFKIEWNYSDNIDPNSPEAEVLAINGRGSATGDGKFVRSLKLGDVVTLWGKARFPGWVNHIDMVKVEIFWAV